ncbi:hypothetical protein DL93DRAFT_442882 [Clavulina sp. PMI_390]|nr:hypothetical protein DL93DRAFT_442882 [Clavulina sp. PMI_390]
MPIHHRSLMWYNLLISPDTIDTVTLPNQTEEFLALSPKGLLPALRLNDFSPPRGLNESLVILDYLNDLSATKGNKKTLLPPVEFTWSRALLRLQADLISRTLVPTYFRYLQSQDPAIQEQHRLEIIDGIEKLIRLFERAEQEREDEAPKFGLWEEEGLLSLPDILLAPWVFRARITLKHYRGFSFSPVFASHPRFEGYVDRLMGHPAFKATCSTDDVCLDSAASYAANRSPSQIAAAINRGREIP